MKVQDFVEKPKVEDAPWNLIRNWVAILPKEIFQKIDEVKADNRTWETNLPDAIKLLKNDIDILAMEFKPYRDIWNIQARMKANNELYTKGKLFN
jgi:UTP-glucose-1-phosphate uridylyltransferase